VAALAAHLEETDVRPAAAELQTIGPS
jgi:hypothetical protein